MRNTSIRHCGRTLLLAGGWAAALALNARGQNVTMDSTNRPPDASTPPVYTVNLAPPNVVGQKFALTTDESEKMKMHIQAFVLGLSVADDNITVETAKHFEADAQVLDVFPNGEIKKITLTVTALRVTTAGNTTTKLPPGAAIVAEALEQKPRPKPVEKVTVVHGEKGRTSIVKTKEPPPPPQPRMKITVDGREPAKEIFILLENLVALGDGKSTKQEKLGPPGPVAVGATWPVKAPDHLLFDDNADEKPAGADIPVTATGKLEEVQGSGAEQVVKVTNHFLIKDFKPPLGGDVPVDSVNCTATGDSTITMPATRTAGAEKQEAAMEIAFQAKGGKLGISAKIAGTGEMKSTTVKTYEQQKPAADAPNPNQETPAAGSP